MRRLGGSMVVAVGLLFAGGAGAQNGGSFLDVTRVVDDVEVRVRGGDWEEAVVGQRLVAGDEISTGPASELTVRFPDDSVMVIRELSQVRVGALLMRKSGIEASIELKLGEVSAQVNPRKDVSSDFSVSTPIATASVRGTQINRIRYTPASGLQTKLDSGRLLVMGPRRSTSTQGQDAARVTSDGDLQTPADLTQDDSRLHVEPYGLTDSEVDQIAATNEPSSTTPTGGSGTTGGTQQGATLIFRFVVEQ